MKPIVFTALFLFLLSSGGLPASAADLEGQNRWTRNSPAWARNTPDTAESTALPLSRRTREPAAQSHASARTSPFAPGSNNLSVDVGQVFLMGNLGDRFPDAIGTRLNYTYGVSDLFSFNSSFGYSNHSDGGFSMTSLLAGLRTNLAWYDKVIPHAIFGMGFYRPSFRESNYSTTLFGVHLGGGVNLELTDSLFFGASMTFHDTFGTDRGSLPLGGSFTSFFVSAGVSF